MSQQCRILCWDCKREKFNTMGSLEKEDLRGGGGKIGGVGGCITRRRLSKDSMEMEGVPP